MLVRDRLSRIYYNGHFFHYPLRPMGALLGLGPIEAARVLASYVKARIAPSAEERTFEQWVVNRFGRRLFEIFFKTYTEKVWGMPCSQIGAEWASQRIKNLDLATAIRNALLGSSRRNGEIVTSLIDRFHYPRLGPGMMWERTCSLLAERGIPTRTGARVTRMRHRDGRVVAVTVREAAEASQHAMSLGREGLPVDDARGGEAHATSLAGADGGSAEWREREIEVDSVITSMPLASLVRILDPAPPPDVLAAAGLLRYRDFLTVGLVVEREEMFPDHWIYVHSPDVQLGRIQNFKNWSPEMVPDPRRTSLGLEYFVERGGELWNMDDAALLELGARECETLGLLRREEVSGGTVIRMPRAYPVYDDGYRAAMPVLRGYLAGFENLHVVGRNGQHRYNNQDHSMLAGMLAARNVAGESHDVWAVNVETDYHEEIGRPASDAAGGQAGARGVAAGDRLVPQAAAPPLLEDLLREAFARYDPVALGGAVGAIAGLGLFLATAILLLRGGAVVGPNLSLLGNYLYGYAPSWSGALVGSVEAGLGGFGLGYLLGRAINALVHRHEVGIRRRLELASTLDPLGVAEP
jgi:protoporphyrinogen oxidase